MSEPKKTMKLTPAAEGFIGGLAGTALGVALFTMGVISVNAIPGVTLGLGLGSWFNAWRRAKNAAENNDKGDTK